MELHLFYFFIYLEGHFLPTAHLIIIQEIVLTVVVVQHCFVFPSRNEFYDYPIHLQEENRL